MPRVNLCYEFDLLFSPPPRFHPMPITRLKPYDKQKTIFATSLKPLWSPPRRTSSDSSNMKATYCYFRLFQDCLIANASHVLYKSRFALSRIEENSKNCFICQGMPACFSAAAGSMVICEMKVYRLRKNALKQHRRLNKTCSSVESPRSILPQAPCAQCVTRLPPNLLHSRN